MSLILAGDVGGTTTRLGLFGPGTLRPRPIVVDTFKTIEFGGLSGVVAAFAARDLVRGAKVDAACFGVAGRVTGDTAELTNVAGWPIDAREVARAFAIPRVTLMNDLRAMAYAVPALDASEVSVLQEGAPDVSGNLALLAAGTGLGESILHRVDGAFVPLATEGGHADFPARTEREIDVLRDLIQRFGRARVEDVVSGRGLVNLARVTHAGPCEAVADPDAPAEISKAALARRCRGCADALDMFVDAYGAEAGNLALRSLATAGVFVGGGIAPKILPALSDGRFLRAFTAKAPFHEMLERIPVKVILNDDAGLLGAAVYAGSSLQVNFSAPRRTL
jgi:glucokinase